MSLRIAEHAEHTDPGLQRKGNEDAFFVSPPVFAVADGMGGAQAGEVASHAVVEQFQQGLPDGGSPSERLAAVARAANDRIRELARSDRTRAGMGTTVTAAMVAGDDVTIAHVGDSRAYRLRGSVLEPLTRDHSLVQALIDQGRLTEEEALTHPQRSIITRALGAEDGVEVETSTVAGHDGDLFLLCSDGLTSMIGEDEIERLLVENPALPDAAAQLVEAANAAGGKDNITVVLFRVEEGEPQPGDAAAAPVTSEAAPSMAESTQRHDVVTSAGPATAERRRPIPPRTHPLPADAQTRAPRQRSTAWRRIRRTGLVIALLSPFVVGAWIATRAVFFLGTNDSGQVTVFRGLPYDLPGGLPLYQKVYVTGVPAVSVSAARRETLLDHKLRSQSDALDYAQQLELGKVSR